MSSPGTALSAVVPQGTTRLTQQPAASGACLQFTNSGAFHLTPKCSHLIRRLQSWKTSNALRGENASHSSIAGTASRQFSQKKGKTKTKHRCNRGLITCRSSASQEALPAPPETWPIEPPLEKVEHERYMYPADTLPGYVSHSKDPRVPVKHKTVSAQCPLVLPPYHRRMHTRFAVRKARST